MIIGLTGTVASGKGVVAEFFKRKGFIYFSLSDELREKARALDLETTRKNLQELGNKLRKEFGKGILAELVKSKISDYGYGNIVIDGIRNPGEIEVIRKLEDFFLIAVDAPLEIRFERMKKRGREGDALSWEEFLKQDESDKGKNQTESGQCVAKCMEEADFIIINDGDLQSCERKAEEVYIKIIQAIPRLSWDEYFIKMASLVAERSTCLRHHVGAIIVKNKRVLTTGYNGAARGVKDCRQLGCLRQQLKIPSGTKHEICRAIHAEQNAIIQAGLHGINIDGSVMYCTHTPCIICAKMIVQAGIKEVISYQDYADEEAKKFLNETGITLRKCERPKPYISFID